MINRDNNEVMIMIMVVVVVMVISPSLGRERTCIKIMPLVPVGLPALRAGEFTAACTGPIPRHAAQHDCPDSEQQDMEMNIFIFIFWISL